MNRIVFIVCILIGLTTQAQQGNIQQLQEQLPQLEGKQKINALNKLAEQLKFDQPKEAASYAEEALKLSEKIKYQNGIYASAFHLGIYERDRHNYRKATRQIEKAIKAAQKINKQSGLLKAYKVQELLYQIRKQKKKATAYAQAYSQLKNEMDLVKRNKKVEQLEREVQTKAQALKRSDHAVLKAEQEKEEILITLRLAEAQKLQQEAALARLEQEAAELEKEAAILEKESAMQALKLEEERNLRNIAFALAGGLILLILAGWQRYRFKRQQKLAEIEKQRVVNLNMINHAISRFVPNDFLRSLGRENITEVLLGDQTEKEVTVLFCDIRDFTRLSESMTPTENFKFVNAFNRRMGPIITQYNGFINQYLGDAIMAIFAQNPADALNASIEMQKSLQTYNKEREARGRQSIRMGIGFHTGSLIMGITGDQSRLDATTISDTVNTASRIESLTKHYGTNILFSEDSLSQIEAQENFHLRYLGKVQMKGKKIPVGVYECFDGNLPVQVSEKLKTKGLFEKGLKYYFEKAFYEAIKTFEAVLDMNPTDKTAQMFLYKCQDFLTNGVSQNWTGVEVRTDK